jgi:hypothetical protein
MKSFKFQGDRFSKSRLSTGSEKLAPIHHERNKSMQTLMTSGKDHFSQERKSVEVSKKLWGNLSITDVARGQDREYNNGGFGVKGYEIKPNQRFNL